MKVANVEKSVVEKIGKWILGKQKKTQSRSPREAEK